jgi:hypothetical protein
MAISEPGISCYTISLPKVDDAYTKLETRNESFHARIERQLVLYL